MRMSVTESINTYGDVRSTSGRRIRRLDRLGFDTFPSLDKNTCEPIFSLASNGKAIKTC